MVKNYRKKNKTTAKRTPTEAKTLLLENARQRMSQQFNKPKRVDITKPIPSFRLFKNTNSLIRSKRADNVEEQQKHYKRYSGTLEQHRRIL
jgi:hypothetical protein